VSIHEVILYFFVSILAIAVAAETLGLIWGVLTPGPLMATVIIGPVVAAIYFQRYIAE
jgi:hypothetical protein